MKKITGLLSKLICFSMGFADSSSSNQENNKQSRYVPGVVSITQDHNYLRTHLAPAYWKMSPYYLSQPTDAACSLATATMVINALRIPQMQYANQKLATTNSVVHSVNNTWADDVKQGGYGVSLDQFGWFLEQAIKTYNIQTIKFEIIHATRADAIATKFHQALVDTEKNGKTLVIINFDQKFISGAESAGHFAPVGAYDISTKRGILSISQGKGRIIPMATTHDSLKMKLF